MLTDFARLDNSTVIIKRLTRSIITLIRQPWYGPILMYNWKSMYLQLINSSSMTPVYSSTLKRVTIKHGRTELIGQVTSVPLNWVFASRQFGHDEGEFWIKDQSRWCVQVLVLLSLFVVANFAAEDLPQEKDLICDICQEIVSFLLPPASRHFQMDQVTQLDAFLTSDPTEAQITEWVKSICHMLAEVRSLKARKVVSDNRNQPNQVS